MQGQRSPSAARRQLGARLRQLRDNARLTGKAAGERTGTTHATISKYETGKRLPELEQLDQLLDVYNVPDESERAVFHELLDDASGDGWWEAYDDVLPHKFGTYIGLELDAAAVTSYEPLLIHGLLQTPEYARALLRAVRVTQYPDEIERLVEVRMRRKDLFHRSPPLRLTVIMEEAAIHRPVGGTEVMQDQLDYLLQMQREEHIRIHILPFSLGAHIGLNGSISLLSFEDEPPVGYSEGPTGNNYLTKPRDISRCKLILQRLEEAALSTSDTNALIAEAAKELR